jgi:hypothetical protein
MLERDNARKEQESDEAIAEAVRSALQKSGESEQKLKEQVQQYKVFIENRDAVIRKQERVKQEAENLKEQVQKLCSDNEKLAKELSAVRGQDSKKAAQIIRLEEATEALQNTLDSANRRHEKYREDSQPHWDANENAKQRYKQDIERAIETRLTAAFAKEAKQFTEEIDLHREEVKDERQRNHGLEQHNNEQRVHIDDLQAQLANAKIKAKRVEESLEIEKASLEEQITAFKEESLSRDDRARQRGNYKGYREIWDDFHNAAHVAKWSSSNITISSSYWSKAMDRFKKEPLLARFRERYAGHSHAIENFLTARKGKANEDAAMMKSFVGDFDNALDGISAEAHYSRALMRSLHLDESHLYDLIKRAHDVLVIRPTRKLWTRIETTESVVSIPYRDRRLYRSKLDDFQLVYRELRELFTLETLLQASAHDKAVYVLAKAGSDELAKPVSDRSSSDPSENRGDVTKERLRLLGADDNLRAMISTRFTLEQECGMLDPKAAQDHDDQIRDLIQNQLKRVYDVLGKVGERSLGGKTSTSSTMRSNRPVLVKTRRRERSQPETSGVTSTHTRATRITRVLVNSSKELLKSSSSSSTAVVSGASDASEPVNTSEEPRNSSSSSITAAVNGALTRTQKSNRRARIKKQARKAAAANDATNISGPVADSSSSINQKSEQKDRVDAEEIARSSDASATRTTTDKDVVNRRKSTRLGLSASPRLQNWLCSGQAARFRPLPAAGVPNLSAGLVERFSHQIDTFATACLLADRAADVWSAGLSGRRNLSTTDLPQSVPGGSVTPIKSTHQVLRPSGQSRLELEPEMGSLLASDKARPERVEDDADSDAAIEVESTESDTAPTNDDNPFELTYRIPNSSLSEIESPSDDVNPLHWTHKLYKNSKGQAPVVFYCTSYETCERQAKMFLNEPIVGFDLEWETFASLKKHGAKQNVSLIQIASESQIGLFHVACFKGTTLEELMPPSLRTLLESESITKTGVNVVGDANRLRTFFQIEMKGLVELSHLYRIVRYSEQSPDMVNFKLCGLAMQVKDILRLPLKKDETRVSRWSSKLNAQQIEYAAADAYAGFHLYHALENLRIVMDPRPPRPAFYETLSPLVLPDGTKVYRTERKTVPSKKKATESSVSDEIRESEEFFDALEVLDDKEDVSRLSSSNNISGCDDSDASEIIYPKLPTGNNARSCHAENTYAETSVASDAHGNNQAAALPLRTRTGVALPSHPETRSADSWAQAFLAAKASIDHKKDTGARLQKPINASTLRAYHLWHEQNFEITQVAAFCRQPPLALTTVATYVMSAIKEEGLPFDAERAQEVLKALPASIKGRYARFVGARSVP